MLEQDQDSAVVADRPKWVPLGSVAMLVALAAYAIWMRTLSDWFAAALLALSVCIDSAILIEQRTKSRLAKELGACEWPKLAFLIGYALIEDGRLRSAATAKVLSGAALSVAIGITLVMLYTAAEVIRKAPAPHRQRLFKTSTWELLTDKVLGLAGVLIAFLHVAYCLAFALAFSDRASVQLYATDDGVPQKTVVRPRDRAAAIPLCPAQFDGRVRKFFFSESVASLRCTFSFEAAAARDPRLRTAVCENGVESLIAAFQSVAAPACDQRSNSAWERRAAALNLRELYALRSVFGHLDCGENGCSYLVEVRGHANDTGLKKAPVLAYASNYEISKQRADQVTLLLNDAFRESTGIAAPAMRWLSYGVSNEESFLDSEARDWIDAKPLDQKLSVEVRIVRVADSFEDRHLRAAHMERRTLDLLDYLYFTFYTITTTGYGDIKPVSGYAKFVVTLANLIELLFVVAIFNVIANTRPENPNKGDPASPSGDDHAPRA